MQADLEAEQQRISRNLVAIYYLLLTSAHPMQSDSLDLARSGEYVDAGNV